MTEHPVRDLTRESAGKPPLLPDVPCPSCRGGRLTVTVHAEAHQPPTQFEMPCPTCRGTGRLTDTEAAALEEEAALWCRCAPDAWTFGSYPEDGRCPRLPDCYHKHHVHCGTCGKVSQLG